MFWQNLSFAAISVSDLSGPQHEFKCLQVEPFRLLIEPVVQRRERMGMNQSESNSWPNEAIDAICASPKTRKPCALDHSMGMFARHSAQSDRS